MVTAPCGATAIIWVTLIDALWETDLIEAAMVRQNLIPPCPLLCHHPPPRRRPIPAPLIICAEPSGFRQYPLKSAALDRLHSISSSPPAWIPPTARAAESPRRSPRSCHPPPGSLGRLKLGLRPFQILAPEPEVSVKCTFQPAR